MLLRIRKKYINFAVCKTKNDFRSVGKRFFHIELEANRATGFLLGLIVGLTLMFVALEYRSGGGDMDDYDSDDDDAVADMELMPQQQRKDMIAYMKPGAASHSVTNKIKKVEQTPATEVPTKMDQTDGDADTGNGEGQNNVAPGDDSNNETTAQAPVATDMNDNPLNFRVVEKLPEFPGGMVEFMKWITKNLRYPKAAQQQKIQGKVLVAFIIGKDGTVSELKVTQKVHPLLDAEALRVMKMMPKWKPGEDKGKPCLTYFCIPVNFVL